MPCRHLGLLPDADDRSTVLGMTRVVLLPIGKPGARPGGHHDARLRPVDAGLEGALGRHELAVLVLPGALTEVPDVACAILRVPVPRVLDEDAVLGDGIPHDAGVDPVRDALHVVGHTHDDAQPRAVRVRLAVDPARAGSHRPERVVDPRREIGRVEHDALAPAWKHGAARRDRGAGRNEREHPCREHRRHRRDGRARPDVASSVVRDRSMVGLLGVWASSLVQLRSRAFHARLPPTPDLPAPVVAPVVPITRQMEARATHTSPVGLVALATKRSAPALLAVTNRASNEPLGARVTRTRFATCVPFRRRTTFHRTPFRFWSTSNSTSTPASSPLSFSFAVLAFEHVPATRTPSLAPATGASSSAAATTVPTITPDTTFISTLLPRLSITCTAGCRANGPGDNGTLVVRPERAR